MGETKDVTAVCRRSGGWWAVEVPEIPGLFTVPHAVLSGSVSVPGVGG